MTISALARKTGAPIEMFKNGLKSLQEPDHESRNPTEEGRRIVLLDEDNPNGGWRVVNYKYWRDIFSNEDKKRNDRERIAEKRERKSTIEGMSQSVATCRNLSQSVALCSDRSQIVAHTEAEAEAEVYTETTNNSFVEKSEKTESEDLESPEPEPDPPPPPEKMKGKPTKKSPSKRDEYFRKEAISMMETWNSSVVPPIATIKAISEARISKVVDAIKYGLKMDPPITLYEVWPEIIQKILASSILTGRSKDMDWKADFDFLFTRKSGIKNEDPRWFRILEGAYDTPEKSSIHRTAEQEREVKRMQESMMKSYREGEEENRRIFEEFQKSGLSYEEFAQREHEEIMKRKEQEEGQ